MVWIVGNEDNNFSSRYCSFYNWHLLYAFGKSRKYKNLDITERHFVETGKVAGLGLTIIREIVCSGSRVHQTRDRFSAWPTRGRSGLSLS
jgi:hypothetical protein